MSKFYHPYEFIPLPEKQTKKKNLENTDREKHWHEERLKARHDLWKKDRLSGCITCTLENFTALIVGNKHKELENKLTEVCQYTLPGTDDIGIPANSLRGMISSTAEIISASPMRVVENKQYSIRKTTDQALSAIGMLLKKDNGWELLPLTKPQNSNNAWDKIFSTYPEKEYCALSVKAKDFNKNSYNIKSNQLFYIKKETMDCNNSFGENTILSFDTELQKKFIRGLYFVLSKENSSVKWVPYTKDSEQRNTLIVDNSVIECYQLLAEERGNDKKELPYLAQGHTHPADNPKTGKVIRQPKHGDIVYFDIKNEHEVSEFSYSAIWRQSIKNSTYQYIEPQLLPLTPDRDKLSAVELLFGVLEADNNTAYSDRNLASRVRFFDASGKKNIQLYDEPIILKRLMSPKPPSPAFYFKKRQGSRTDYIKKSNLNPADHKISGRKIYLHHPKSATLGKEYWRTKLTGRDYEPKQHMQARPIKENQLFTFSIEFNNLSKAELSLLVKAICPDIQFQHHLGLGKPIGLGSIKLSIDHIRFINRVERYKNLNTTRYESYTRPLSGYDVEGLTPVLWSTLEKNDLINTQALEQLKCTGNINKMNSKIPVCYPFVTPQKANNEKEGFKWFQENDNSHGRLQKNIKNLLKE